jgi:hypothetical protein
LAALTFLGEVDLPADVVWVEFDFRELIAARVQRNSPSVTQQENTFGSGLRGYLIDSRSIDVLHVTMFTCDFRGKILELRPLRKRTGARIG